MIRIDDILRSFSERNPGEETTLIQRAYIYASRKHEGQNRRHYYVALCEGSNVFELCYDPKNTAWRLRSVYIEG